MIAAKKPYLSGELAYTILAPFEVEDKIEVFRSCAYSFFVKNSDKEITSFKIGCEKETAKSFARSRISKYAEIKMSSQLLEISDVRDVHSENAFISHERIYGWLVFVDENIFANWGHECRYVFYVNDELMVERQMLFPPSDEFVMEVIH